MATNRKIGDKRYVFAFFDLKTMSFNEKTIYSQNGYFSCI